MSSFCLTKLDIISFLLSWLNCLFLWNTYCSSSRNKISSVLIVNKGKCVQTWNFEVCRDENQWQVMATGKKWGSQSSVQIFTTVWTCVGAEHTWRVSPMACCNCRDALCVLHGPVPVICQGQLQQECLLWFTKHIWALLDLPACQELLHTQGSLSSHLITWKRSLKPCQTCLQSLNFVFGFLQLRGCRHLGLLQFSVKGRGEVRAEQRTHLCLADLGDGAIKCLNWDETTANTTQALRCFCGTLKCCHFVRCCSYFVVPLIKILTV